MLRTPEVGDWIRIIRSGRIYEIVGDQNGLWRVYLRYTPNGGSEYDEMRKKRELTLTKAHRLEIIDPRDCPGYPNTR